MHDNLCLLQGKDFVCVNVECVTMASLASVFLFVSVWFGYVCVHPNVCLQRVCDCTLLFGILPPLPYRPAVARLLWAVMTGPTGCN